MQKQMCINLGKKCDSLQADSKILVCAYSHLRISDKYTPELWATLVAPDWCPKALCPKNKSAP